MGEGGCWHYATVSLAEPSAPVRARHRCGFLSPAGHRAVAAQASPARVRARDRGDGQNRAAAPASAVRAVRRVVALMRASFPVPARAIMSRS
jgi:hypothetical protein